jgi:hypothetical protein
MSESSLTSSKRKGKKPKTPKPKKPFSSRTKSAILSSSDDAPSTSSKGSGSDLPEVKRRRIGDGDFTTDATPRPTFEVRKHDDLPAMTKVKLLPRLVAKAAKIAGISFGRSRTPSPFGGKMGDHTGSWASVVDSVHARLYGQDLAGAVGELTTMQADAQAWMNDKDATGTKLWQMLDQTARDRRQKVLGHYAFMVDDLLTRARGLLSKPGSDGQVAELLAEATAHHLAFLNYLPFATVPAAGDSGSRGSGEGTARAKVLDVELDVEADLQWAEYQERENEKDKRERLEAEAAAKLEREKGETPEETLRREADERAEAEEAKRQQLANAHEGLWGLFSMEAAVRAADVERGVAPAKIAEHLKQLEKLQGLTTDVNLVLSRFILPPGEEDPITGKKRRRSSAKTVPDLDKVRANVEDMLRTAEQFQRANLPNLPYKQEVQPLVTDLIKALQGLQTITGKVAPGDSDTFEVHQETLTSRMGPLNALVSRLSVDPETARADSALLLAHLVREHQRTVARAYPNAVEQTEFLGANPDEDAKRRAAARILSYITDKDKGVKGVEDEPARRLAAMVVELYPGLGATPTPGPKTRWVADSRNSSLVAAFKDGNLSIQGRPPTPPGVGGMGSHTTAWVVEKNWMLKKVAEVGKDEIVETLQDAAKAELNDHLMTKLAHLLPAEQLAAGQLGIIFDAALDVMAATEPTEAITAFLSFRNLLPYATVDAGDRGGKGERARAAKDIVFDDKSLQAAIEQKLGELSDDRLGDTIKTLRGVADLLRKDYDALAESDDVEMTDSTDEAAPQTWQSVPEVAKAVTATIDALLDEADRLEKARGGKADAMAGVWDTIYATRKTEHDRVYAGS